MNNTAVVMITCQKFHQAWEPFFTLFSKYWPDCPFKIYMITDYGKYDKNNIINITLGKDEGFSSNLLNGLNQIPENKIIYFQEDYFFNDYFDTSRILKYIDMIRDNVYCIRLAPCPGPTAPWTELSLGILQSGDPYRVSTQTAIWSKDFLKSLLVVGETGGDFEIKGTKKIENANKILLSVWREQTPTPYYITGIVRGVWQDGAIDLLNKEGIDTSQINRIIK